MLLPAASAPGPPAVALLPGYWAECWSSVPGSDQAQILRTMSALDARRVVVWVRVTLRTLASSLDDRAAALAWSWVEVGYTDALAELERGDPYTFSLGRSAAHLEWRVRPVRFLPLAGAPHCPMTITPKTPAADSVGS